MSILRGVCWIPKVAGAGALSTVEHVRPKQTILHNLFALDLTVGLHHGDLCAFEMESLTDVTKHAFT